MEDQFKQTMQEAPVAPDLVFGAPEENREGQELTVSAGKTDLAETADRWMRSRSRSM